MHSSALMAPAAGGSFGVVGGNKRPLVLQVGSLTGLDDDLYIECQVMEAEMADSLRLHNR